ncbi:MAG: DUF924 family protein [Cyanobacteria bacterium J06626_14]
MTIDDILEFWFGVPGSDDATYQARRKLWFRKNPETDQTIRDRFLTVYEQAIAHQRDDWQVTPKGSLALTLVLDQFPRNMFRDTPKAFASDAQARDVAQKAIDQGFDQNVPPLQRFFFYLPLEHSEDLSDQEQSVYLSRKLFDACPDLADTYDYAVRHKDVIEQFGRFPHRNAILGRESTAEELDFLKQPGSSF